MERLLILSTIILLAIICTFLLAVGAYLLFKARERKREKPTPLRTSEIIPPFDLKTEGFKPKEQPPPYIPRYLQSQQQKETPIEADKNKENTSKTLHEKIQSIQKFLKYTPEGYIPPKEDKNSKTLKWR